MKLYLWKHPRGLALVCGLAAVDVGYRLWFRAFVREYVGWEEK